MNFLSHYHFYKSDDPYYNVGLVLPDLARNLLKTHLKHDELYTLKEHQSLKDGSLVHIKADKIFHQSAFFASCERHISSLLDHKAQWPRKWFFNHLLLEIGLDRVLMEHHRTLCDSFYKELEQADLKTITSFLKLGSDAHSAQFASGYERFVSFRFIFDYEHNEKIFLALSRVYSRIGIQYDWTRDDQLHFLQNLPDILDFIGKQLPLLESGLKIK